jgi:aldehyde dehydrogenase (NAD+)
MIEHQFLDGRSRQLLIGGRWIDAQSGETFESRNPANGVLLTTVAKAGQADVDFAVEAARGAFESGPWPRFSPAERQQLLLRPPCANVT